MHRHQRSTFVRRCVGSVDDGDERVLPRWTLKSYRYMVGIGLESWLALSGGPSGVCGVHRLMVDSLRDICEPSLPPPSAPLHCISLRFIPLLRLATAS